MTVRQYRILCDGLRTAAAGPDRVLCGHALFCVGVRGRAGDVNTVSAEPKLDIAMDGSTGFVEASTDSTKTSNTAARRRISIPLVAVAFELDGYNWAELWLNERAAQGLRAEDLGCLLPAPRVDGAGWTKRRM